MAGEQVRLLVDTGSSDLVLFKTRMPAALSGAPGEATRPCSMRPARRGCGGSSCERPASGRDLGHTACLGTRPSADGYPPGIDGVLGVLALGCQRVQFDFENGQFGWSR